MEVPVVIDAGSASTRIGIAGDLAPAVVLPSVYAESSAGRVFGDAILDNPEAEILAPVLEGIIHDWEPATQMWQEQVAQRLGAAMRDQPLALVQELWNPVENMHKALGAAFETLEVPLFSLLPSPKCAAFESARTSAIVVNIGASGTSVTPIIDGVIARKAYLRSRLGGNFLTANTMAACAQRNISLDAPQYRVQCKTKNLGPMEQPSLDLLPKGTDSYHTFQVAQLADEIRGYTVQVAPSASQVPPPPAAGAPPAPGGRPRTYEFPSGYNVIFDSERLRIGEPLFKPATAGLNVPENSHGVSDMIYQSLNKVDASPETVASLLSNIIVCGGTTLLTGFTRRLENDMVSLLPNYSCKFHIPALAEDRKNVVWTGASVLASIGTYDQSWVTRQEYDEMGAEHLVEKRFK